MEILVRLADVIEMSSFYNIELTENRIALQGNFNANLLSFVKSEFPNADNSISKNGYVVTGFVFETQVKDETVNTLVEITLS